MIVYEKALWGFPLLTRIYGSAFPRTLPVGVATGIFTAVLATYRREAIQAYWIHPFAYSSFATVVGFILVFRSNFSYQRWWEARGSMQQMTARWADAAAQILTFDKVTMAQPLSPDAGVAAWAFGNTTVHLLSLMHALACSALRRDAQLENLTEHCSRDQTPPADPAKVDRRKLMKGSKQGAVSWKDLFVLRGSTKDISSYNANVPLSVIGALSEAEFNALGCPTGDNWQAGAPWTKLPGLGGDLCGRPYSRASHASWARLEAWRAESLQGLEFYPHSIWARCCSRHVQYMDRPNLVMTWLQQHMVLRMKAGGLDMPAPILARSFQLLSEGMVGYEQCRKLADTPFPFPWAQFIVVILILYTFTLPLLIIAYVESTWLAVLLSVTSVVTYWALNEVARDTEDPFLFEPNDLPLATLQFNFNELLLAQFMSERPPSAMEGAPPSQLWSNRRRRKSKWLQPLKRLSRRSSHRGGASDTGSERGRSATASPTPAGGPSDRDDTEMQGRDRGPPVAHGDGAAAGGPQVMVSTSLAWLWQQQQEHWQQVKDQAEQQQAEGAEP